MSASLWLPRMGIQICRTRSLVMLNTEWFCFLDIEGRVMPTHKSLLILLLTTHTHIHNVKDFFTPLTRVFLCCEFVNTTTGRFPHELREFKCEKLNESGIEWVEWSKSRDFSSFLTKRMCEIDCSWCRV